MDTVSIPITQTHSLNDKWNLYYHLPHDKNWELSSYSIIMANIGVIESIISLNHKIHDNVIRNCMLFIMRVGITPMWEDPSNRNGGCFSYKVSNKCVPEVWKNLFFALAGETLMVDRNNSKYVNGITISPKKNFCIIKIWLSVSSLQDPNSVIQIPSLMKQGCLFKRHEPEF